MATGPRASAGSQALRVSAVASQADSASLSLSLSLWAPGSVASGLRGGIRGIALYLLKKESKTDRKGNELRNFERSDSAILSTILKAYALPFQKDLR